MLEKIKEELLTERKKVSSKEVEGRSTDRLPQERADGTGGLILSCWYEGSRGSAAVTSRDGGGLEGEQGGEEG